MSQIYDFTARTSRGQELALRDLEGKVILIVNTASKCGFTPQYEGLEELHRRYGERGLVVLAFPCNQFASQEPGSDAEIASFCQVNYGVSFQTMQKIEVNGPGAHPLYQYLKRVAGGCFTDAIKWNFTKFLVSRDGSEIKRYAPITAPKKLTADIERMLG